MAKNETITIGSRTISGNIITPNVADSRRMLILVDDDDFRRWSDAGYGGDGTVVTDLICGSSFELRRADCGAGCACATRVVR